MAILKRVGLLLLLVLLLLLAVLAYVTMTHGGLQRLSGYREIHTFWCIDFSNH